MDRGASLADVVRGEPTAAELATADLPIHHPPDLKLPGFVPPAIYVGPSTCTECGRPYAQAWWSIDKVVEENRHRFRSPRPGETTEQVLQEERQRHQALLVRAGAIECPRHCGFALVPAAAGNTAGISANTPGNTEITGTEGEEDGEEEAGEAEAE